MSSQDRTAEFGSLVAEAEAASAPSPAAPPTGVGGGGLSRPPSSNASADPADELRNFHQTASDVSRDIAATSALLSELTRLVRRRSLFIDDSDRVNWLVLQIKRSIQSLDSRLDDAGAVIARSKRRLGRSSQRGEEVKNLEETLRTEYKRTADGFRKVLEERSARMKDSEDRKREVVGGSGSGSGGGGADGGGTIDGELALGNKPIVYDDVPVGSDPLPGRAPGGETGSAFLQAGGGLGLGAGAGFGGITGGGSVGGIGVGGPRLDLTSAVMLGQQQQSGGAGAAGAMSAGESSSSYLPRPGGIQHEGGGSTLYNDSISPTGMRQRNSSYSTDPMMGEYSGGGSSMMYGQGDSSHHQQQPLTPLDIMRAESQGGLEQTMQLIPDQNYLRERADVMETVESQIGELGTIFNKLAVMVSEHADMVQRVEDNVDDAADTINLSMAQLTDTLENLRTNRALALKVFGVIAIFIILFITFFA